MGISLLNLCLYHSRYCVSTVIYKGKSGAFASANTLLASAPLTIKFLGATVPQISLIQYDPTF